MARVTYLLDTNILIGLALWHPFKNSKVFWKKFEEALQRGEWILLDTVVGEIEYEGALKDWCKAQKKLGLVRNLEDSHRERGIAINNMYPMVDEATQKSDNDPYIIAYAEANSLTVFTREGLRKQDDLLHKIPDVCRQLQVPYIRQPEHFMNAIGYSN